ncbi:hypothetical protein NUU61_003173 [Penicillium alfredii]|uniref:Uncharacterized protein n=1 Tax=Penicillium alfredii TaxID=1506179 RepID=A0A9W9KH85_9EURO|nr:uncharacterized protein NUU61_003173 [Penicillium alfredii]KAJ5105826.1 hypothetical protein NUU61_003173 [Penicillium alfredii]
MPFPHWLVLPVSFPVRESTRQPVLTSLDPNLEQTDPIVQGENRVIPAVDDGFMMYSPSASHVEEESGQQSVDEDPHVAEVQSWTAPMV